ncbi:MAG: hypothetical protein CO182_00620, partial [Lysobacterales bacterium CG_4_9_14_3_um_filter_62_6]
HPGKILGVALLALVASLLLGRTLGLDLVPQLAQGQFEATFKLPPGTPLARTDAIARQFQEKHQADVAMVNVFGVSGTGTRLDANPTESGENVARMLVT